SMMLAHYLWAHTRRGQTADEGTWIAALDQAVSDSAPLMRAIWRALSNNERRVARALAAAVTPLHSEETAAAVGIKRSSIGAALGEVLIWTDGACQRNPGPGGWAALVCWEDGVVEEHSGGLAQTTNNVMEMTAALEGLRALPPGSRACVVTDSRYLHDGMTSW